MPSRAAALVSLLLLSLCAAQPRTPREQQARLASLTRPSVCHARRTAAQAAARRVLKSAQACTPTSTTPCPISIPQAQSEVDVSLLLTCPPLPSMQSIQVAISSLATSVRTHVQAAGWNIPFPALVYEPAGVTPHATVVLLHGLNGTAAQLDGLVRLAMTTTKLMYVRVVVPQADVRFNSFRRASGPSWFDLLANDEKGPWASGEIDGASWNVSRLMDIDSWMFGTDRWKGGIIGFSQGGALGLGVYLRQRVSAVAVLSGFLPDPFTYPRAGSWKSRNSPVLMVHGSKDEVVDVRLARFSVRILRGLGRTVTYEELPGRSHSLNQDLGPKVLQASEFVAGAILSGQRTEEVSAQPLMWKLER